jgi:hypothetical protein
MTATTPATARLAAVASHLAPPPAPSSAPPPDWSGALQALQAYFPASQVRPAVLPPSQRVSYLLPAVWKAKLEVDRFLHPSSSSPSISKPVKSMGAPSEASHSPPHPLSSFTPSQLKTSSPSFGSLLSSESLLSLLEGGRDWRVSSCLRHRRCEKSRRRRERERKIADFATRRGEKSGLEERERTASCGLPTPVRAPLSRSSAGQRRRRSSAQQSTSPYLE